MPKSTNMSADVGASDIDCSRLKNTGHVIWNTSGKMSKMI